MIPILLALSTTSPDIPVLVAPSGFAVLQTTPSGPAWVSVAAPQGIQPNQVRSLQGSVDLSPVVIGPQEGPLRIARFDWREGRLEAVATPPLPTGVTGVYATTTAQDCAVVERMGALQIARRVRNRWVLSPLARRPSDVVSVSVDIKDSGDYVFVGMDRRAGVNSLRSHVTVFRLRDRGAGTVSAQAIPTPQPGFEVAPPLETKRGWLTASRDATYAFEPKGSRVALKREGEGTPIASTGEASLMLRGGTLSLSGKIIAPPSPVVRPVASFGRRGILWQSAEDATVWWLGDRSVQSKADGLVRAARVFQPKR
ncbi:MAG: hypothetical protein ACO1SV_16795 [Fimbriimonas sp.]